MKHSWKTVIERGSAELIVTVAFNYSPGADATLEQPADPEEFEVHYEARGIGVNRNLGYLLSSAEIERIEQEIVEEWDRDDGPDPDDARDRAIDDKLMGIGL